MELTLNGLAFWPDVASMFCLPGLSLLGGLVRVPSEARGCRTQMLDTICLGSTPQIVGLFVFFC
jgi:hypothetical protein